MKIQTLKPRVQQLREKRIAASAVPRIRGRARVERNARLFMRNPLCVVCKKEGRATPVQEWDHIVPLYAGGADHESNMQGLCIPHHQAKTARDLKKYPQTRDWMGPE